MIDAQKRSCAQRQRRSRREELAWAVGIVAALGVCALVAPVALVLVVFERLSRRRSRACCCCSGYAGRSVGRRCGV